MHVHSAWVGEKGAYNFTSAHHKKYNKLGTNTHTHTHICAWTHETNHTHTHSKDKWERESLMKEMHPERKKERKKERKEKERKKGQYFLWCCVQYRLHNFGILFPAFCFAG